ncbi:MAG: lipoyl synthase [Proteobacteria bacterium]|nr:lipoyl synthase [Pseudomonadota bacterium]
MPSGELIHLLRMGRVPYRHALRLMQLMGDARRRGDMGDALLLVEHPPVITLGCAGGSEDLRVSSDYLQQLGIEVVPTERGGRVTYHGPGQLVVYPILKLPNDDLHDYLWRLEQVALEVLNEWGIAARRVERHPGVWIGRDKIAAVGVAVQDRVTTHGLALNVDPDMAHFQLIVPCGLSSRGVTSMRAVLGQPVTMEAVEHSFAAAFSHVFMRQVAPRQMAGPWLVAPAPQEATASIEQVVADLSLHTVCQEAACPNIGECWARGTATFMLLGDVCTRHCRFCNVKSGHPLPPDPQEPFRVAEAAVRMGLHHVVLTSVTRDDLSDGGASQFVLTIQAIRNRLPGATVEVLVPDFGGSLSALDTIAAAQPDVFNHNVETVERLSDKVRAKAEYRRSLAVLAWAKQRGLTTKSGLMVGLGETCGEVIETMRNLRRAGCDILTIGQYLQPTNQQLDVVDHVHPVVFAWYREVGRFLGFQMVMADPLVRSSYHAEEVWSEKTDERQYHKSCYTCDCPSHYPPSASPWGRGNTFPAKRPA